MVIVVTVAGTACAKVRADVEPPMPVLLPPPPPPRIVETYVEAPILTVEPTVFETTLEPPPMHSPARPPVTRPEPAKPEPERIEPERSTSAPTLTLKPAPGVEAKTQASIRALLDRAMRDLQNVNYAALDADGRTQFETARRFMQQAEDAIKVANLLFAGKLADKAATMAAVLVR